MESIDPKTLATYILEVFSFHIYILNALLGNHILKSLTQFLFTSHSDKILINFNQDLAPAC